MTPRSRQLLQALESKGLCRADATGMTQAEIRQAVTELGTVVGDDNRELGLVSTWHDGDDLVMLELTPMGRTIARSVVTADSHP